MAISADERSWYLINASPDLARQIEAFPELQPRPKPVRNTPIRGVLITNADLDHLLGVFTLREGGSVSIHAPKAVRAVAEQCLGLGAVLEAFSGVTWTEPSYADPLPLGDAPGGRWGLLYRAIALPGGPPRFIDKSTPTAGEANSVAYEFLDNHSGKRLLVAPDVGTVNEELRQALAACDAVFFDGTFWSADELTNVRPGARSASDMGHVTIRDVSLDLLAGLAASKRVYLHINNTNPILAAASPERAAVEAAGIIVGYDGLEFEL